MKWIDFIEERPYDGQECLVCDKNSASVIFLIYNDICESWDTAEGNRYCGLTDVDYWMPMPAYKY